jgi:hypothetical protein
MTGQTLTASGAIVMTPGEPEPLWLESIPDREPWRWGARRDPIHQVLHLPRGGSPPRVRRHGSGHRESPMPGKSITSPGVWRRGALATTLVLGELARDQISIRTNFKRPAAPLLIVMEDWGQE